MKRKSRWDFWEKVDKSGGPTACWPWLGASHSLYGTGLLTAEGMSWTVCRLAYESKFGRIPSGVRIGTLPTCTVQNCCNPDHLLKTGYFACEAFSETKTMRQWSRDRRCLIS